MCLARIGASCPVIVVGIVFSVLVAVTMAGCGDQPPQQQFSSPSAAPMHPALDGAVAALRNVTSFGFVERWSSNQSDLPIEFSRSFEAAGNYESPDRLTKRAFVHQHGFWPGISVRSISIGDARYLTDPATEDWMLFHDDLQLRNIFEDSLFRNPVDFFSDVLSEGGGYENQGVITLNGVSVHHFVSTTARSRGTRTDGTLRIEIWVGVEDSLVRQMTREHSWIPIPCDPDEVCQDILVTSGSENDSSRFSFPGDSTPIVAPPVNGTDTVSSPFGPTALFKNAHAPFSIRYPADWKRTLREFSRMVAMFWDDEEPSGRRLSIETEFLNDIGFRAEHSGCFEESVDEFSVAWCNVVKRMDSLLAKGELGAEDYTDFWFAGPRDLTAWPFRRSDIEVMSRQTFGSGSDWSAEALDIGVNARTGSDTPAVRRLTYVHRMQASHPECGD